MADAVERAIFMLGADNRQYDASMAASAQKNTAFVASSEGVVVAEERVTAATRTTADGFARLEARYDPLIRAEQRRQAAIDQATRHLQEGIVTQDRYAAQIARVNAFYDAQAAAAGRTGVAIANSNRVMAAGTVGSRNLGFAIQNAGFQVGDFAVQVASGSGVLRPFIQQGTQLISMFGPWGAVIGAAGAVVGALAIALTNTGDASRKAANDLSLYTDALKGARELLQTSKEASDALAASHKAEGEAALIAALAVEQATIRRLENIRELRKEFFEDLPLNPSGNVPSTLTAPLEAEFAGAIRRAAELEKLIAEINDPSKLGKAREEAAKAAKEGIEIIEAEVDALTQLISSMREENDLLKLNAHDRAIETAVRKAQDAAIKDGNLLTEEQIANVKRLAEEKLKLLDAEKARTEALASENKAMEEARRAAEKAAEEMERPFIQAAENIQQAFGDLFTDIFDKGIDSAKDFAAALKGIFARLAGEIAAAMVIKPILSGINFGGVSGGQSGGGFLSGLNFGNLFGTGGQPLPGTIGPPTLGQSQGLFGGGFSGLGAGLGALTFGLPLLFDLIGGNLNPQGIGQGIGGIAGSIGGAFLGPLGSILGGLVGSTLGSLVGGIFGQPNNYPKAAAYFGVSAPGVESLGIGTANQGSPDLVKNIIQPTLDLFDEVLEQIGGTFQSGGQYGYLLGGESLGGIQNKNGIFNVVVGDQVIKNLGTGNEGAANAIATFVAESIKLGLEQGTLTDVSETFATVFQNATIRTAQELQEALDFATFYDELKNGKKEVTQAELALEALDKQFAEMRKQAEEFGLALDVVDQGLADAKIKLTTDFNKGIRDQILAITDPLTLALEQLAEAQEQRLEEAVVLGADLVEVERLNALERQRVVEQFTAQTTASLTEFYRRITFGDLALASPTTTLSGTRATFEAAAAQALAGDLTAQANIQGYAEQFLQASQTVNASSPGYFADLARVQAVIGSLIGVGGVSLTDAVMIGNKELILLQTANNNSLDQIVKELQGLRLDNTALQSQIGRLLAA